MDNWWFGVGVFVGREEGDDDDDDDDDEYTIYSLVNGCFCKAQSHDQEGFEVEAG